MAGGDRKRRARAGLESSTTLHPDTIPVVVRSEQKTFESPVAEFFTLLESFVTPRIGPCPEDRVREITFDVKPDKGVVEFSVTDKLKVAEPEASGEDRPERLN